MVKSPCKFICTLDSKGIECMGCHRTKEEISKWSTYTDDEKQKVINRLKETQNVNKKREN